MTTSATVDYRIAPPLIRSKEDAFFFVAESKDLTVVPPEIPLAQKGDSQVLKRNVIRLTLKIRLLLGSVSIFLFTMVSTLFAVTLERGEVRISLVWIMLIVLASSCAYVAVFGNAESKACSRPRSSGGI